jgi:hypothetical protein
MSRAPVVLCVLLGLAARAEDEASRRAREELEKQLTQLVGERLTRVRLDFEALDEPSYALKEAAFQLDGQPLPAPGLGTLGLEGSHRVWEGDVRPGPHNVRARVTYQNQTSIVLSDEGGYAWRLSGDVSFEVQQGLEVQVRVVPVRDGSQRELSRRMRLSLPATPVMLARVDDGTLPEAPPPPRAAPGAVAEAPSGGTRDLDQPSAAPRAPRDRSTSRRSVPEPAEGARRPGTPAPEVSRLDRPEVPAPLEPASGGVAAPPPAEAALLPATRPPPDAPTEPLAAEGEVPWAVLGGLGAALLVAGGLALLARRRSRQPPFDDRG